MFHSRSLAGSLAVGAVVVAVLIFGLAQPRTEAQSVVPKATDDIGISVGRAIATRAFTLNFPASRGEPREVNATVNFGRRIETFWISVVGVDVRFTRTTKKQLNRQLWSVKPTASVGGKEVELRGRLGLRDGSGDFGDSYEGIIDVQVTAVLRD